MVLRASEGLSSLIEENIPEKKKMDRNLDFFFGFSCRVGGGLGLRICSPPTRLYVIRIGLINITCTCFKLWYYLHSLCQTIVYMYTNVPNPYCAGWIEVISCSSFIFGASCSSLASNTANLCTPICRVLGVFET